MKHASFSQRPTEFIILKDGILFLLGEVRMPSGKTARPHITDNKDGTVTVKYAPTEKGLHEMDIKYDGNHIPGIKTIRGLLL